GDGNVAVPLRHQKICGRPEFLNICRLTTVPPTPLATAETGADAVGYGVVNLTLFSQNLVKGVDLSASVYNLLENRYGDPSTPFRRQDILEQDGRSLRVKLTYRF